PAAVARHQEDEAEPVLAGLSEARPADRAAQDEGLALDAGLLADFPAHAGHHVLVALDLAAQAVVLAQVVVTGARVAVDHQDPAPIRRKDVTQGRDDGCVGHLCAWLGTGATVSTIQVEEWTDDGYAT